MRSATTILSVAALAGLAAASPAPQQLNFDNIAAAPTVAAGPAFNGVVSQTASLMTIVSVSSTATASVTGQATAAAIQKRSLEKRSMYNFWCAWFGVGCSTQSSSVVATTSATVQSTVKTSSSSSAAVATSAVTSSYYPYYPALSTATQYTTGTTTISSTSSCPTTPEDGTYCGFLNPEDPCGPQPDGYGPVPTPDTVEAFYAYDAFHSMASAAPTSIAAASVASGVAQAYQQTFRDMNASTSAQSYLGVQTLQTYDAAKCAAICDSIALCTSFNLYIERDPSVAPSANDTTDPTVWGYWCPNPASMTSYKCSLWGSNIDASSATNAGQWREQFQIVITGSSGWDKTNVTVPAVPTGTNPSNGAGWSSATNCQSKAINAPSYWMASKFFPGPFNSQLCADYALAQNKANKAAAQLKGYKYYTPCNMFNSYFLHKNNRPHGTYCALYDTDVNTRYATYQGGSSGSDKYTCKQSYKFTLKTPDNGSC